MDGLDTVFAYIDDHRDTYLARLLDYVSRPSISAQGIGIGEVAEYAAGMLRDLGLDTRVMPTEGWPMVLGTRFDRPESPTVLLYGHYDVQPPDPVDAWDSPPFQPEIRNGRVYGRGVADNKGQHLAQILAIEALLAVTGQVPVNIKLLLEGEEEVGSPHMPSFVRAHREDLTADLVITSDGPVHQSGLPQILFGVRGVLNFELRVRGAKRDLHSGNWGGVAPNPLWTLVHLLASMKNEAGEVTIEGFYDDVLPQTELEQAALARLPEVEESALREMGVDHFDQPSHRGYYERLTAWPTFTINGLHGGYGGPGSKTVLPHEARAKCDMRLVEAQRADVIFALVEAHVARHAPEVEVIRQGSMDPSKTPLDSPYSRPLQAAVARAQGVEPLLVPALGGSLPEYVFTQTLGLPAFGVPYANADEANHAPNENLEVERFMAGIKTGAALLSYLGARE